MNPDIPIIYAYVYFRLKNKLPTNYVCVKEIKEEVGRVLVRHAGFPRFLIKYVVKDLEKLGIIEKINLQTYKLVDSNCDKKIRQLLAYF